MGVVEELVRAREAYDRREWVAAYDGLSDGGVLAADDFARLATAAYLLGHHNDCVAALQRAHQAHLDAGETTRAVRCAFWLALVLLTGGETAVGSGWVARAQRLLDDVDEDVVERGYLLVHLMFRHIGESDFAGALAVAEQVEDYGRRFRDPDLTAMGISARGRLMMYAGQVPEGLALFDEAMVEVASGEVSPIFSGQVYCAMIEACQEVSDFGRAAEWTAQLTRWCDSQPGLVPFTGQCAVHRGQIMRVRGAYPQALDEFDRALERYVAAGSDPAAGLAWAERGEVLRIQGEFAAADAAFEHAVGYGHDPQPARALLWLQQGREEAAVAAVRRLLGEPRDPVHRCQVLPVAVEVLLAHGAVDEAAGLAEELDGLAERFCCAPLRAAAAHALATVAAAKGDSPAAAERFRQAEQQWSRLGSPYESARARAGLGAALRALGDEGSARAELTAAHRSLVEVGAVPAARHVDTLLAPSYPAGLTGREVEVLRLVARGRSNPEIAADLVLSEKTVARHLSNIFTKLDVRSRTAAAAYAFEHHLT
jgi:DNA-binding NarL/FixJ family response regulator